MLGVGRIWNTKGENKFSTFWRYVSKMYDLCKIEKRFGMQNHTHKSHGAYARKFFVKLRDFPPAAFTFDREWYRMKAWISWLLLS